MSAAKSASHLNATHDSWRIDETYVNVKQVWMYLYRAVDSGRKYPGISLEPQA
jgi:transposase-like protein